MKKFLYFLLPLLGVISCNVGNETLSGRYKYDICIYGGTSSGVISAVSAARMGKTVLLIEPTMRIGGLTAGGLGQTDIGNKQVVTGLSKDFYRRVGQHYGQLESWIFEPKVALSVYEEYLADEENVDIWLGYRLVSSSKKGNKLKGITVESADSSDTARMVKAKVFIDCSYEGDLMASAGVSYTVGRESNSVYGETWNGVQMLDRHQLPDGIDPYVEKGNPASGLIYGISDGTLAPAGSGDDKVQAYNFRICLTDDPDNRIPLPRPANYDSTRYELMLRLFDAQPGKRTLDDYFIWSLMPGRKTDINNCGGFSTDAIGMNAGYVEGSYADRERIFQEHVDYTLGMLYFVANDPRVPHELSESMSVWGLPEDEYVDTWHWTPHLYVREGRRMKSAYIVTQNDCEGNRSAEDWVAKAAYTMDSHNCQRIVIVKDGKPMVKNEGNVEVGGFPPYPISYRAIVPFEDECANLVVPVCLSASHIAYGSIRMEPVFMVLGQSAAIAASLAVDRQCAVQDISGQEIRTIMDKDPYLDGTAPDVIIDDNDVNSFGPGWEKTGKGYGPGSMVLSSEKARENVKYVFEVPEPGKYDVYSYYSRTEDADGKLLFNVSDGEQQYPVEVDAGNIVIEGQTSGKWIFLGTYSFSADGGYVEFVTGHATGNVYADAVQVIKRQ